MWVSSAASAPLYVDLRLQGGRTRSEIAWLRLLLINNSMNYWILCKCPDKWAPGQYKRTTASCPGEDIIIFAAVFKEKCQFLRPFDRNLLSLASITDMTLIYHPLLLIHFECLINPPTWNGTLVCLFIRKGKVSRDKAKCLPLTEAFSQEQRQLFGRCWNYSVRLQLSFMGRGNEKQAFCKRWDRTDVNDNFSENSNWFSGENKWRGNKHISMKAFRACTITNKWKGLICAILDYVYLLKQFVVLQQLILLNPPPPIFHHDSHSRFDPEAFLFLLRTNLHPFGNPEAEQKARSVFVGVPVTRWNEKWVERSHQDNPNGSKARREWQNWDDVGCALKNNNNQLNSGAQSRWRNDRSGCCWALRRERTEGARNSSHLFSASWTLPAMMLHSDKQNHQWEIISWFLCRHPKDQSNMWADAFRTCAFVQTSEPQTVLTWILLNMNIEYIQVFMNTKLVNVVDTWRMRRSSPAYRH